MSQQKRLFFGIVSVGYHTTSAYFPRTTVSNTAFFVGFGFIFRFFLQKYLRSLNGETGCSIFANKDIYIYFFLEYFLYSFFNILATKMFNFLRFYYFSYDELFGSSLSSIFYLLFAIIRLNKKSF